MSELLPVPPPLSWRARAEALLGGRTLTPVRLAVALGGLAVVVGLGGVVAVWVLRTPPSTESLIPLAAGATSAPSSAPELAPVEGIVVQAAGAVAAPGVYRLPNGARVIDLIDAAGGLAPGADPNRLALAAKVADGERVSVGRGRTRRSQHRDRERPRCSAGHRSGHRGGDHRPPRPARPVHVGRPAARGAWHRSREAGTADRARAGVSAGA